MLHKHDDVNKYDINILKKPNTWDCRINLYTTFISGFIVSYQDLLHTHKKEIENAESHINNISVRRPKQIPSFIAFWSNLQYSARKWTLPKKTTKKERQDHYTAQRQHKVSWTKNMYAHTYTLSHKQMWKINKEIHLFERS